MTPVRLIHGNHNPALVYYFGMSFNWGFGLKYLMLKSASQSGVWKFFGRNEAHAAARSLHTLNFPSVIIYHFLFLRHWWFPQLCLSFSHCSEVDIKDTSWTHFLGSCCYTCITNQMKSSFCCYWFSLSFTLTLLFFYFSDFLKRKLNLFE